jgi:hypothetical protein
MPGMHQTYRVIQWGTGNTGSHALRFLLDDPTFELVGVSAARERNRDRTAGEIIGREPAGPGATNNIDEIVALDAECVIYMAAEPKGRITKPGSEAWHSVEIVCRLLESGKNVVCVGISGLTNPHNYGPELFERLRDSAERGGSTFFATGIEPGFMCDALALSLTSVSRHIRSIRIQEIISYATYGQSNYHVSHGGIWGSSALSTYADLFPRMILASGMDAPVRMLAQALDVAVDDVIARAQFAQADRNFKIPMGPIAKETIAGYRFEVIGLSGGEELTVVEHVTRIDGTVAPEWPKLEPGGFRILLDGTPSYKVEVTFDESDSSIAACTGTAARAVNSVAAVCRAPVGVFSFLDLPMISAAGSVG